MTRTQSEYCVIKFGRIVYNYPRWLYLIGGTSPGIMPWHNCRQTLLSTYMMAHHYQYSGVAWIRQIFCTPTSSFKILIKEVFAKKACCLTYVLLKKQCDIIRKVFLHNLGTGS